MNDANGIVADDLVVSLEYKLHLGDDQVIESTEGHDPLVYLHGHDQIIPGLEAALDGMAVGDTKRVVVSPDEGYGRVNPSAYETMARDAFPAGMELSVGQGLNVRDAETNEVYTAFIDAVNDEDVRLNFNHPLAGETLHFDVKVVDLRPATGEELAHGHAHGSNHDH
jgi:FKBP-type peptidyl-prolyl cis-trans isomerase SlyD